jgi:uncharacterized NAD(P)/FAD-binding protein YdhS
MENIVGSIIEELSQRGLLQKYHSIAQFGSSLSQAQPRDIDLLFIRREDYNNAFLDLVDVIETVSTEMPIYTVHWESKLETIRPSPQAMPLHIQLFSPQELLTKVRFPEAFNSVLDKHKLLYGERLDIYIPKQDISQKERIANLRLELTRDYLSLNRSEPDTALREAQHTVTYALKCATGIENGALFQHFEWLKSSNLRELFENTLAVLEEVENG